MKWGRNGLCCARSVAGSRPPLARVVRIPRRRMPRMRAMVEGLGVVRDEFRAERLNDSAVLQSVGRQVHRVTGGQMQEFVQRLQDAAPIPLTEELILEWADEHFERTRAWPHEDSGQV